MRGYEHALEFVSVVDIFDSEVEVVYVESPTADNSRKRPPKSK
jgi:hypothetical protein